MEAVDVSVCKIYKDHANKAPEKTRVWLVLTGFMKNELGEMKIITSQYGSKYIQARLRITRSHGYDLRGDIVTHLIPVSGECSAHGRRIIRDMMEASGFARKNDFHSYSITSYTDLINIHFPAFISNGKIEHIINPYTILSEMEVG